MDFWPGEDQPMVAYALFYASAGIPIFPCAQQSKLPIISKDNGGKGVLDATTDYDQIEAWWAKWPNANIGGACGHFMDGLDVDGGGEETLMAHDALPKGPEVKCPGGGSHLYLFPSYVPLKNGVRFADGLDFRTMGGYVMMPPSYVIVKPESNHPDEKKRQGYQGVYKWVTRIDEAELPPVPMWIVELIRKDMQSATKKVGGAAPPAVIDGGARNNTLFAWASHLRRYGMEESVILENVRAINRIRCNPPVKDQEVVTLVASAAKYQPEREPRSYDMPGDLPQVQEQEARSGHVSTFLDEPDTTGIASGFDFVDENTVCSGFADGQMHVIAASTGGGKSALMLQIARIMAAAGKRVCYVTMADLTAADCAKRLIKNLSGWGKKPERWDLYGADYQAALDELARLPIHIYDCSDLWDGRDVKSVSTWIRGNADRFDVFFLDYAQEMTAGAKSEYEDARLACHEIRWLAAYLRKPIIVGSQLTEGNDKAGTSDITKGSRVWMEKGGTVLIVKILDDAQKEKVKDMSFQGIKDLTTVYMYKNRFGPRRMTAYWQFEQSHVRFREL